MVTPDCKACLGTWPFADRFITECGITHAYLHDDQFFPGWTVLVLQRHATELFHLTSAERARLIEDVSAMAGVLSDIFQAAKINYELLGNQLPHIHWHLIPRLHRDPAPLEPVWRVAHAPLAMEPNAQAALIERLRARWNAHHQRG
ncbi:MAG: HIT family protein [Nitrospiraceae bacterium]|nr:HIT family protein [Nitrospiraceae bacterium]